MRILLLEDNPSDADLTKRGLIRSFPNCTIEHASTLEQARKLLNINLSYDIALLDVNLPDGNGLKFLSEIRQRELNFPVLMLTGSGDEDAAVTALKAGANDYIVKRSGYILHLPDIINLAINNYKENDLYKSEIINVLYIEHHAVDIDFTVRHLAQYAPNIQIDAVATAEEALSRLEIETANSLKYKVILMDYRLPGMNALELIKAIRQNIKICIPIILVTGQGNEELAVQALKLGANDYLTKSEKYLYRLPSVIVNSYQHCELKRKQEALVESESKYRLLADNSGDVIFVLDMDLNYTYISPAVKVLRGFEPEEAIKQKLSEVLTPASYQKAAKVISEILSENLSSLENQVLQKTIELEMIRKDKTTIWTEVKATLITEKNINPVGIIGVTRDISERKSIMDKLRKLSRAVEQSPALIVITDTKGNIEYVNPKFTEITGYSLQEVLGKNSRILKSGYTTKSEYENLWNTITAGHEWKGEFQNKRKDGSLYWEDASISSIKTSEGQITHFLSVKSDITEKKKIFDELILAKEKAEESDNLKTAFLHNISHEIRTPLNAIVGFSSIIGNSELQAEKRKEFLDVILMSNDQLLSIISGIIALATLEAGQEKILEKETDINELLSNVYEQFRIGPIKPEVTFSFHPAFPDELAIIYTDPVKLMQILVNLVENALKFTHKGFVRYGYRLINQKLEFFVEDTGIGIPSEMHGIVFERFRQIDNSPTRLYGGAGLGLALSNGYVELLGGEMQLQSEPGKGSVFAFTIPYKPVTQTINAVRKKEGGELAILSQGWTILVAEDEYNNFLLISELLNSMNLNTIRAENGRQAVNICSGEVLPDLVLMDIKMPEMDGIEATLIIKKQYPHLPVIALTAYVLDPDRKRIMDTGCDDYIEKPVKQKVLYDTLKKYLK